jgi:uncharacterized phage-associated protein|nr:MAG TPA: Protein of unknown function (DUF4065) [Crassvirales sp.]
MKVDKIEAFDYMLHLFEEWRDNHETIKGKPFPKLTAMKLLFLAAAPKEEGGDDLLDIFDNFYAMPYGPVESDVYNAIQANMLPSYIAEYRTIERRDIDISSKYKGPKYEPIRKAVKDLRTKNENLIELNAFELVEITHKWNSWNLAMNFAEFMGQLSAKMSIDSIRDSSKIFDLK